MPVPSSSSPSTLSCSLLYMLTKILYELCTCLSENC
jgi:hypothetical protein